MPGNLDHVFLTSSGSESADTALKIALGYHYVRGNGSKMHLIGRERGYHGTNFGGTSGGGIVKNRQFYGGPISGVDHIRHTLDIKHNAFSKGQSEWRAHLADDLERLVQLHDASTIAAVLVEPVAGSTGVLIPPKGYLQRLREICDKHDILLIFDEVITGFGRLGTSFVVEHFNVEADIVTTAKGLTNAAVPMARTSPRMKICDAFMENTKAGIELFGDAQNVQEGDLLFLIDPASFEADVQLAEANVAKASAAVESTSNQFEWTQTLYDQGDVTKARLDEDQSAARHAAAELLATEAQFNQA